MSLNFSYVMKEVFSILEESHSDLESYISAIWDTLYDEAYTKGKSDGYKEGYDDGYQQRADEGDG
jgi:hypothetical protein